MILEAEVSEVGVTPSRPAPLLTRVHRVASTWGDAAVIPHAVSPSPPSPLSVNGEGESPACEAALPPSPFTERGLEGEVRNDSFVIPREARNLHRSDGVCDNASLSNSFMNDENGKTRLYQMLLTPLFTLFMFFLLSFALAQPPLIAILQSDEGAIYTDAINRFHQEMEKQGVDVQTLIFVLKDDESDSELPERILSRKPKMILAVGMNAALRLKKYYESLPLDQQPPVVFTMVMDPVQHGLVQSAERSGTRFAGVTLAINPQKQLRALKDSLPEVKRVGVVYTPEEFVSRGLIEQARKDAERLGLSLVEAHVSTPKQLNEALGRLRGTVDAFWIIPDAIYAEDPKALQTVMEFSRRQRIPTLGYLERFAQQGALVSVGIDMAEQGALAAEQSIRILNGEKPEDLPLLTPRRALTYYNLKAARALGITIPDMLLNLAAKVYE